MDGRGASKFPHAKTASRIACLGAVEEVSSRSRAGASVIGSGAERGSKRRACMGGRVIRLGGWSRGWSARAHPATSTLRSLLGSPPPLPGTPRSPPHWFQHQRVGPW